MCRETNAFGTQLLLETSRYSHVVYVFVESSPFYAFHREFGKITFSPIPSSND